MGQIRALLLDLDDTLLDNDMAVFLPAYLPLLAEHACRLVAGRPDAFIEALLAATRATIADADPGRTCGEVFWASLAGLTGIDWVERGAPAHFDTFYRGPFHRLRGVTAVRPAARCTASRKSCLNSCLQAPARTLLRVRADCSL